MTIHRDADTQAAIDLAREELEPIERRSERLAREAAEEIASSVPAWDSITLTGPELVAYRALRDAAAQAHAAQQSMATTGQALRDAIQKLCAVIAPGTKP